MKPTTENVRKVILATNIAESSITVPDVKYVIDFCLTRNLVVSKKTHLPALQLEWASRDNCIQRAGRTGRVMNGKCFRLVSRYFFEHKMKQGAQSELVTSPLENIILKSKQLNLGSPEEVLALAMDKPKLDDIHNSVVNLKAMGAMLLTSNGRIKERDGDITTIGRTMSNLPLDVKLSKLIILGNCFGVLNECIIIASALNCSRNIFKEDMSDRLHSYSKLLEFANGSGSDLFALLNAYRTFKRLQAQGCFSAGRGIRLKEETRRKEKEWAEEHCLDIQGLRECDAYVKDITIRVKRYGFMSFSEREIYWKPSEKHIVLKVVFAGAFYPNFFSRSTKAKRQDQQASFKTLCGRDPCRTVYFTGIHSRYLPYIYSREFIEILIRNGVVDRKDEHIIKVSHDAGTERVYITFQKNDKNCDIKEYGIACQPGFVLTEVYKAIKLGSYNHLHRFQVLSDDNKARRYARRNGINYRDDGYDIQYKDPSVYEGYCLPKTLDKIIQGSISHTENCGRFWFQPMTILDTLNEIYSKMNEENDDLKPILDASEIYFGQILAAKFTDDYDTQEFYRAKVVAIQHRPGSDVTFTVFFIDYGNTKTCLLSDLRRFRGDLMKLINKPPCCFECSLAEVQPSQVSAPDGIWSEIANNEFIKKTNGEKLKAKIYSVVNGITRVILRKVSDGEIINEFLLENGHAECCEETFMSKDDRIERDQALLAEQPSDYAALHMHEREDGSRNALTLGTLQYLKESDIPVIPLPTLVDGEMETLAVKGPYSPLTIKLYTISDNDNGWANIDRLSVNSVLLENEPHDESEKHLVAVSAFRRGEESVLTACKTTQMPNIRLFAPLMAAIFAPRMALQKNKDETRYVRILTGLGCDANNRVLSSKVDMVFNLDAELTNEDLKTINKIRDSLNTLLPGIPCPQFNRLKILRAVNSLQHNLIKLLSKTRLIISNYLPDMDISWEPYSSGDVYGDMTFETQHIFPMHLRRKLWRLDKADLLKLQNFNKEFRNKRFLESDLNPVRRPKCKICNQEVEESINHHIMTRRHKDMEKAIQRDLAAYEKAGIH